MNDAIVVFEFELDGSFSFRDSVADDATDHFFLFLVRSEWAVIDKFLFSVPDMAAAAVVNQQLIRVSVETDLVWGFSGRSNRHGLHCRHSPVKRCKERIVPGAGLGAADGLGDGSSDGSSEE